MVEINNEYRILIKVYNSSNIFRILQKLVDGKWVDICDMNSLKVQVQEFN
jgi:hypothetical protein